MVADTHLHPRDTALAGNWESIVRWAGAVGTDLLVHLGDISASGVEEPAQLAHARRLFTVPGLPVRFVPGNHDIGEAPPGPGVPVHDPLDRARLADYRQWFGSDYWAHPVDRWLLIGLNALLLASGTEEEAQQHAWLEETLRGARGPVGVFLHKPLFRDNADETIVHGRYVPAAARRPLLALLRQYDLRFIASGHTHQARRHMADGVEHVWVPSAAFILPDSRQERIGEKVVGIMLLEIEADLYRFTHVIPSGLCPFELDQLAHIYPELAPKGPPA